MAILSKKEIFEEIDKKRIVIHPYHKENVGVGSIDLCLGARFGQLKVTPGTIDPSRAVNDKGRFIKSIVEWKTIGKGSYDLPPSHSVIGQTSERITLPEDICGWITGRGKLVILGLNLQISTGFVQPDTKNEELFFLITNLSTAFVSLTPGTKICQLILQKME